MLIIVIRCYKLLVLRVDHSRVRRYDSTTTFELHSAGALHQIIEHRICCSCMFFLPFIVILQS